MTDETRYDNYREAGIQNYLFMQLQSNSLPSKSPSFLELKSIPYNMTQKELKYEILKRKEKKMNNILYL